MTNRKHISKIYTAVASLTASIFMAAPHAAGFSPDTYAASSVLKDGQWVKISVNTTGIHRITAADLMAWGFSDPSKVRIFGTGGARISDVLNATNYVDDLPQVQTVTADGSLYFYAVGVESWQQVMNNRFIQNLNPFTTVGYYYVTDSEIAPRELPTIDGSDVSTISTYATSFYDRIHHETDKVSLSLSGHYLLGEDFKYNPSQTFTFTLTDRSTEINDKVWIQTGFAAKTYNASSRLKFTANGNDLLYTSSDDIKSTPNSTYVLGQETTTRKEFSMSGDRLQLGISHSASVTIHEAYLDYITVNYPRQLKMRNGLLTFWLNQPAMQISGATAKTCVWDVTDPLNISALAVKADASGVKCTNEYTGQRSYVAWDYTASLPTPQLVGTVANQDLHSLEVPDMVIFTLPEWKSQADRLAAYHLDRDSLRVAVVDINQVYNEFSSGSPDPGALRRMLKMLWDRSDSNASVDGGKLRYAMLMGRSVFDNRRITPSIASLTYPTIPSWETNTGLNENDSYTTDDFFGFLKDGSGANPGSDELCISVGRMPVRSVDDAKRAVDKLIQYVDNMPQGAWKNRMLLIADDEDRGQHLKQTERFYNAVNSTSGGDELVFDKIYTDSYERISGGYPAARSDMFRLLDEGVWWWNYVGHANMSGWTHEQFLTANDINNNMYFRRYPILYAATCDFLRWDQATLSGAEIMWHTQGGGVIAAISATRPVYISDNGLLTTQMGAQVARRTSDGEFARIGDVYRSAKNGLRNNTNKLRYVLMGDPAMPMTVPNNRIKVTAVNGTPLDPTEPPTIMARQNVTIEGEVVSPKGELLADFNGLLSTMLYDAEHSTTSHGWGDGSQETFEQQGTRLYAGNDSIAGGRFKIHIAMPSEIADNFRPGALNLYASDNSGREAITCMRDIYIYGTDENAADDSTAPVIEAFYLNHESFTNGQKINESPMAIAKISDDRGLNMSQAGIGHQMTLYLDETNTMTDVSQYYTPNADGSIAGTIAYPIDELTEGAHTLKLRVWDTSNNLAESEIEFFVEKGLRPTIYDVYSDANPASVEANFYLTHDRPDAMVTVTVTVYNLLGAEVWSSTSTGRSDMFTSSPVTWDLTGPSGVRVNRGIYLYKASISTDGEQFTTSTRKIAVTAQ